jgi:hypothetical protein
MSDSTPGRAKAGRALIYSLIGFAHVLAILWGVISGAAFPLLDSTGTAGRGCWACPAGLLAGVFSLMGLVTGFVALGEFGAKRPSGGRGKAWSAVVAGCVVLAALVTLVIYFGNRGLMH